MAGAFKNGSDDSEAGKAFQKAVLAQDWAGAMVALQAGADPNAPFASAWSTGDRCLALYHICSEPLSVISRGRWPLESPLSPQALAQARDHESLLALMAQKGADFNLQLIEGSIGYYDPAGVMWDNAGVSVKAIGLYLRHGGSSKEFFSEGDFCVLLKNPFRANDPEQLSELWDAKLGELIKARGMRSSILTRMLGTGLVEGARFLISKGVGLAPVAAEGAAPYGTPNGYGALQLLGFETLPYAATGASWERYGRRRRASLDECMEATKLAIALGEDPGGAAPDGFTPLALALSRESMNAPAQLAWAQALMDAGARIDAMPKGRPALALACTRSEGMVERVEFCLSAGADARSQGIPAAWEAIRAAHSAGGGERAQRGAGDMRALKSLKLLAGHGARLGQAGALAEHYLPAMAAMRVMPKTLGYLLAAGSDPAWRCSESGESLMGLAMRQEGRGVQEVAQELLRRGAPADLPTWPRLGQASDGVKLDQRRPLHHAAKALSAPLCALLLKAGADPNAKDSQGMSPLHLAAARYGGKAEAKMGELLEAFQADGRVDWSLQDKKGRTAFDLMAKRGPVGALIKMIKIDPELALTESGKAQVALRARADGALAQVEGALMDASVASGAPTRRKPSL